MTSGLEQAVMVLFGTLILGISFVLVIRLSNKFFSWLKENFTFRKFVRLILASVLGALLTNLFFTLSDRSTLPSLFYSYNVQLAKNYNLPLLQENNPIWFWLAFAFFLIVCFIFMIFIKIGLKIASFIYKQSLLVEEKFLFKIQVLDIAQAEDSNEGFFAKILYNSGLLLLYLEIKTVPIHLFIIGVGIFTMNTNNSNVLMFYASFLTIWAIIALFLTTSYNITKQTFHTGLLQFIIEQSKVLQEKSDEVKDQLDDERHIKRYGSR